MRCVRFARSTAVMRLFGMAACLHAQMDWYCARRKKQPAEEQTAAENNIHSNCEAVNDPPWKRLQTYTEQERSTDAQTKLLMNKDLHSDVQPEQINRTCSESFKYWFPMLVSPHSRQEPSMRHLQTSQQTNVNSNYPIKQNNQSIGINAVRTCNANASQT